MLVRILASASVLAGEFVSLVNLQLLYSDIFGSLGMIGILSVLHR